MPILWKVLIFRYLKTAIFCTLSLICISIISSLQEIVSYIAKDVPYSTVLRLTAYQIPYLLPFILPISCFISSFSLFRRLSDNNQITFLKASGASQGIITFPILMVSCAICCINFYTCSELASICRFQSCKEIAHMAMTSPTLLLQTLQKKENNRIFIAVDHCAKSKFDNVIIALKRDEEIANVGIIKTIIPNVANDSVTAKEIIMISKLPDNLATTQDGTNTKEYYIETLDEMLIPKITSTLFAGKSYMKTRTDYLPWKQLVKQSCNYAHLPETLRRIGIGLLCITLTYSGMVLGTYKPRFRKSILRYCLFPIIDLVLLIVGKNTNSLFSALMLFIIPQLISWVVFTIRAYRENRGYA
ncbi:LptF/LptG family permease [Chlamydia gallinacea]|uniref:Permease n=2 Tax=Chlamydia gallinacea TaxID=1457153 RepID=A0A173DY36_9CHLA|nr:LptF/LptG family permease [Chlamydia gallinacea]EYE60838.1 putative permease YjgP/YjgQ family protein [Bacteroides fragilis str. S6L5]ANG65844.1 permease [Chlamydia gallinacea 08-1274/3]AQT77100.1 permease [Chlamydia gallinacea]MBX6680400.1 LptF/LptG family permease [Chlamydia gallinacea]MBX6687478.1 LptF/LptG family permease [Chlamydia gallinacea]